MSFMVAKLPNECKQFLVLNKLRQQTKWLEEKQQVEQKKVGPGLQRDRKSEKPCRAPKKNKIEETMK